MKRKGSSKVQVPHICTWVQYLSKSTSYIPPLMLRVSSLSARQMLQLTNWLFVIFGCLDNQQSQVITFLHSCLCRSTPPLNPKPTGASQSDRKAQTVAVSARWCWAGGGESSVWIEASRDAQRRAFCADFYASAVPLSATSLQHTRADARRKVTCCQEWSRRWSCGSDAHTDPAGSARCSGKTWNKHEIQESGPEFVWLQRAGQILRPTHRYRFSSSLTKKNKLNNCLIYCCLLTWLRFPVTARSWKFALVLE